MLCPSDTPEGEACGLVKNLALLTHVTTDEEIEPVRELAYDLGVQDVEALSGEEINSTAYLVFLNGLLLGVHRAPSEFAARCRMFRRHGLLGAYVSVYVHDGLRTVHLSADGGRPCRPLIIVKEGKPLVTVRCPPSALCAHWFTCLPRDTTHLHRPSTCKT